MRHGAPASPAVVSAMKTDEEIKRDKVSLLHQLLRKSYKVKDFKTTNAEPIREWLVDFDDEVNSIAKLSCNLDLEKEPLSCDDYIDILRDELVAIQKRR